MKYLVFTDLDGSLLDHFDYSFEPAIATLRSLEQQEVPVICSTSKTFAELIVLRQKLGNRHPFIAENGAAVYVPKGYFTQAIRPGEAEYSEKDAYECYSFVQVRSHWQQMIAKQKAYFSGRYTTFEELGCEGIAEQTDLSIEDARLANEREYGEPVLWTGDASDREVFIDNMTGSGATILQGGRFMHVSGACDKGTALNWLKTIYQQECDCPVTSIAAGDSGNDIAMLEAADKSIIVRSPVHQPPPVNKADDIFITESYGPTGWSEGINRFISLE
jgi:mannosyl-3-phosphoglycerate phosphatase family protein